MTYNQFLLDFSIEGVDTPLRVSRPVGLVALS